MISLALANGLWQFVDISSLQRLQSVEFKKTDSASGLSDSRSRIQRGILAAAIEGSGVWVLVILLAFALKTNGVTSYSDVHAFFRDLSGASLLLTPILVFAIICFMMSTVDGFISAMSYVAYCDIYNHHPDAEEGNSDSLRFPRITTALALMFIYAGYLLLRQSLKDRDDADTVLPAILYAIYAVQISIAPAVVVRFFLPRTISALGVVLSVLAGSAAAILTAISPAKLGIPEASWYVIPPLATLLAATLAYALGTLAGKIVHRGG